MNKPTNLLTYKLFLHIILLTIWSTIGSFLLVTYSSSIGVLGIALNFFIIIFSLTDLFIGASWVSLIVSVALYTGAGYSLLNINQAFLISSGVGAGVFLITTVICEIYIKQVRTIDEKYNRLQQVTDSLVIYDRNSSLMRWKFAQQALTTEVMRGRRYQNDVSLVLFDYRQRDQLSQEEIRRIDKVVAEIIQDEIRTHLDIGFIEDRIGLILPETDIDGALILTKRLIQKFNRQVDARVVAGVGNFPDDAITDEDLYERAQTALLFALNSDQSVVNYATFQMENPPDVDSVNDQTQPVVIQGTNNHTREDYVAILEEINLEDNEWVVWIEGFNQMSDLINVERSLGELEHIQSIEFLFLQANHLVVKISTTSPNLLEEIPPFPGWEVKKVNENTHYLLIAQEPEKEKADGD